METDKICTFHECFRPHYGLGLCNAHWQQKKKGRELVAIKRADWGPICSFPDCGRGEASRGWCQVHYKMLLRGEPLREIKSMTSQKGKFCPLPSCGKPAVTLGYCRKHAGIVGRFPNLSQERVVELFTGQLSCGICKTTDSGNRGFHIDHDHSCCSGCDRCVRGLLCRQCNHALGFFQDKIEVMQSAISYLETHNAK